MHLGQSRMLTRPLDLETNTFVEKKVFIMFKFAICSYDFKTISIIVLGFVYQLLQGFFNAFSVFSFQSIRVCEWIEYVNSHEEPVIAFFDAVKISNVNLSFGETSINDVPFWSKLLLCLDLTPKNLAHPTAKFLQ